MKSVYTLDDLSSRNILDAGASKPARLAVIGFPIAHSASPPMHQAALDSLGIDARYIRLELQLEELPAAIAQMRNLEFIGCNITVPHKISAMTCCDEVHPNALAIGAINTIRFDTDVTRGFNTDGPGFEHAIEAQFGKSLASLKIAIVGAGGGAGQAISTQCALSGTSHLLLINRSTDKLEAMRQRLLLLAPHIDIITLALDADELEAQCLAADLIVNTSSVGLKSGDPSILNKNCLRSGQFVYDTIYQPRITPLLKVATEQGSKNANGLSMLIHQGAIAFQHWFPNSNPLPMMQQALS